MGGGGEEQNGQVSTSALNDLKREAFPPYEIFSAIAAPTCMSKSVSAFGQS
jgi:hypothetical protein